MDVSSELKNASFEVWDNAGEALIAATCKISRFGYNKETGRMRIYDGADFQTVPYQTDVIQAVLDVQPFYVGDLKQTMREGAEMDNSWLLLNGYGIYTGGPEPYLAADYPELAVTAVGSSWVENVDLGFGGAKDYLIIPDARSCAVVGSDDQNMGTDRLRDVTVRPELSLSYRGSSPVSFFDLESGVVERPALPTLGTSVNTIDTISADGTSVGVDNGGDAYAVRSGTIALNVTDSTKDLTVFPTDLQSMTIPAQELRAQSLPANIYIKARSLAI